MNKDCFHCGQTIDNELIIFNSKKFCCNGCKTVYEILNTHQLTNFYQLNDRAGVKPDAQSNHQFLFLDTPEVFDKIIDFTQDGTTLVTFSIPIIHCSSCVWLLESLQTIHKDIINSTVNFTKKTVQITYNSTELKLSDLAQFITTLGYKPVINLNSLDKKEATVDRSLIYKLVIAGFCFGNVMILAFPEYLADGSEYWLAHYKPFFHWMMFALSLPVVFYSAQDYFISAYRSIKSKFISIDIPIAIGILVMFVRSCYEIFTNLSGGYFDTLCGLLFFMLLGKYFQQRTYKAIAFDRDYKSFYPIAITRLVADKEENILLSELKKGDRILIRNEEIIPADVVLMKGEAMLDNSFITGESRLISKKVGEKLFAGSKQVGTAIELELIKEIDQSYLTQLWNNKAFRKEASVFDSIINQISKYFTLSILFIAVVSAIYWYFISVSKMFQVVTAILIIACPCALALSAPFTLGNMMRILGRKKLYVKDSLTIENLAKINHIVFDKTGTITQNDKTDINFEGDELSDDDKIKIKSVLHNSNHPLSRILYKSLNIYPKTAIESFTETIGKGIEGFIDGISIRIGSKNWIGSTDSTIINQAEVYIKIGERIRGKYILHNVYRQGLDTILSNLSYSNLSLLSGDNDAERQILTNIFPKNATLLFNQSPQDKLDYVQELQKKGQKVLMIGDGLNDAGALKQANVGIAIAENANSFSPSCDAILDAKSIQSIPAFMKLSRQAIFIVKTSFTISLLYNVVGLSFAVTGHLEPIVAAILMPISSISVVLFSTISTFLMGYLVDK